MNYSDKSLSEKIDKQMQEALENDRLRHIEKDRKRKNRRYRNRLILSLIAALVIAVLVLALVHVFSSNIYKNEEEFSSFADSKITENELYSLKDTKTKYEYSKPFSVAIRRDNGINHDVREFRNDIIKKIIAYESVKSKNDENRDCVQALFIDTAAFKSGNGAISLYIHYDKYRQKGRDMVLDTAHVNTYLFNEKNMLALDPLQVLNVNYKDKASEYADEYFEKTYNNNDIVEYYKDFTSANDKNFNKFFITKNGIVFVFDQHTVVSDDLGVAKMFVPNRIIGSAIRPEVLDRYINPSKPMVAITYDDGPGGESETKILKTLAENGSVATFFYLGNRLEQNSSNAKKAVEIGCEIGNHSWDHPQLSKMSKKQIISEITRTNSKIFDVCGVEPTLARPPYGDFNKSVLKASNMAEVLWTVDTQDWKSRDADKVFKAVKKPKSLDGKIILMHSIYNETADATAKIVPWLKKQGYQTVTVSELIKYKTGETPKAGNLYRTLQ